MGEPLNVRRTEKLRRTLAEAADTLGWAETVALSDDPVRGAAKEVKKIMRGGVRSLRRELDKEIAAKRTESVRLQALVGHVQDIAEDPAVVYPTEVVFSRTAKSPVDGLITKTETLSLEGPEEALKAAASVERSLPRWDKLRHEMLDEMHQTRARMGRLSGSVSDVVEGWHGLVHDVLVTIQ